MWNFGSFCKAGNMGPNNLVNKPLQDTVDCSDDEASSNTIREEGLECPICWESFNLVENIPYVLWCGHTLCKNCIMGLQWAVVKYPTLPLQLPPFISCPWCNLLSPRLVYKGRLRYPRKNFFLLWMLENRNGDREKSHSDCGEQQTVWPSVAKATRSYCTGNDQMREHEIHHLHPSESIIHEDNQFDGYNLLERLHLSLKKLLCLLCTLDSQVPADSYDSSHHSVCSTGQRSHVGPVHANYCRLCSPVFPHSVLRVSDLGLASEGDHHMNDPHCNIVTTVFSDHDRFPATTRTRQFVQNLVLMIQKTISHMLLLVYGFALQANLEGRMFYIMNFCTKFLYTIFMYRINK